MPFSLAIAEIYPTENHTLEGKLRPTNAHRKGPYKTKKPRFLRVSCGAVGQNRTVDTAIFSRMLYQLSYRGKIPARSAAVNRYRPGGYQPVFLGGSDEIRTRDLRSDSPAP